MRRAIVALASTVLGLVLLLSFKSHASTAKPSVVAIAPHTGSSPSAGASPGTTKKSTTTKKTTTTTKTYSGDTYDTQYGPVQVRITVTGSKLTDVQALQLPQGSGRDIEIDNFAVPQLHDEAIAAQSANIDSISGATFTSEGYIRSLQSALDKAGI